MGDENWCTSSVYSEGSLDTLDTLSWCSDGDTDDTLTAHHGSTSRCYCDDDQQDGVLSDYFSSDELDKLSSCLSEASSDSREVPNSVFYDVLQAQLALWTCVFSLLYSYAWRQHRKKFLMSIFFVVPTVFTVCCIISSLLTTIVILGRIFSTPFAYNDFISLGSKMLPDTGHSTPMRKRSFSGNSSVSWQSEELLPRPLCRRHSSSTTSVCCSRPPSRKLSYCYQHVPSECDPRSEEDTVDN